MKTRKDLNSAKQVVLLALTGIFLVIIAGCFYWIIGNKFNSYPVKELRYMKELTAMALKGEDVSILIPDNVKEYQLVQQEDLKSYEVSYIVRNKIEEYPVRFIASRFVNGTIISHKVEPSLAENEKNTFVLALGNTILVLMVCTWISSKIEERKKHIR